MKPEKQQVTDESDRKSSDECSKAKPQKNESPKKHGGGFFCKERLAKLSPFKRCSVERDTISSSRSGPVHYVTEKPLLSKRFASERRATNNPPSGVTSPVTEACIKNKPGATELKDGGFSNRPKIRALVESSSGLNLQPLTSSQKDELYKVLSPEMKEKLDFGFFPPGYKKLLYLLYVDKRELRLLLSSPGKVEQVCSVLPPEERKQLHPNLSLEAKKGLLFKFFGDKQEISRNVSTSSEDSGVFSLSQNSNNSVLSNFSSVNANPMSSMDDAMVECSSSHLQKR
ncbi:MULTISPECIES: hypothetical protein [unclassified Wolbachia]|uniref:hypothetical protein n=1 Tax=unclassified Wolbachia TaxID=2640676 RepID=UPI00222E409A|nr:hypothetical protein [Wolbachia endosymbiont (group A) of Apoderus coryli]